MSDNTPAAPAPTDRGPAALPDPVDQIQEGRDRQGGRRKPDPAVDGPKIVVDVVDPRQASRREGAAVLSDDVGGHPLQGRLRQWTAGERPLLAMHVGELSPSDFVANGLGLGWQMLRTL